MGLLFLLAHHLDRRLRDHPRGLGLEQQVLAAGRPALGGAAGLLRGPDGAGARVGAPDDALALARRDRAAAGERSSSGSSSRACSPSSSTSCPASPRPTATPFDLPEAESELVSGFNTEYSGVKFAFFFLGEYTAMIIISCVAVTRLLRRVAAALPAREGARVPEGHPAAASGSRQGRASSSSLYIWFRSTFPRYRFDQLMALGWKWMIPLGARQHRRRGRRPFCATPGRTNGLVVLSWIYGGLFVVDVPARPAAAGPDPARPPGGGAGRRPEGGLRERRRWR